MFGANVLDILLRLLLLYGLLSLALAMLLELLALALQLPDRCLWRQLALTVTGGSRSDQDGRLLSNLHEHPLARGTDRLTSWLLTSEPGARRARGRCAWRFAVSLLDVIRTTKIERDGRAEPASAENLLNAAGAIAERMEGGPMKQALLLLLGDDRQFGSASGSRLRGELAAQMLETWTIEAAERALVNYRRWLRALAVLLGALAAVTLDLDALRLWTAADAAAASWFAVPATRFPFATYGAFGYAALGWALSALVLGYLAILWHALLDRASGPSLHGRVILRPASH